MGYASLHPSYMFLQSAFGREIAVLRTLTPAGESSKMPKHGGEMMRLFGKKGRSPSVSRMEAMDCRPVRHPGVSEEAVAGGGMLLSVPLRPRPWIAGLARVFSPGREMPAIRKIQLDEMGSAAFRMIDGSRTVGAIIQEFSREYQLHPKEAELSVTLFIRELGRRGIIGIAPGPESGPAS